MALGDTIYLTMRRTIVGLGAAGTSVGPLIETAYTQAVVAAGFATSSTTAPPSPLPVPPAPIDGQVATWSSTFGQAVYANPAGGGELGDARNISGALTTCSATSGALGTLVDVAGVVLPVPPSNGKPVTLNYGAVGYQTAVGDGDVYLQVIETTAGNVGVGASILRLPNAIDQPRYILTAVGLPIRLGAVATARTFKLSVQVFAASGSAPTFNLLNGATNPSYLKATVG